MMIKSIKWMLSWKKINTFLIALISLTALQAQDSNLGNWLIYFGNYKINSKWNWHHEVQYRNYNAIGDLEQLLLRTGVGYTLPDNNLNILMGYGFIESQSYTSNSSTKSDVSEHRIYQQLMTHQFIGQLKLLHRYRFEQRWVGSENMKIRFRYFLSINYPLFQSSITDNSFYLSAYNEIFLNGKAEVFDRNRLYGGLGYQLNPNLKFELGYMNQFFSAASRDQMNAMVFFTF